MLEPAGAAALGVSYSRTPRSFVETTNGGQNDVTGLSGYREASGTPAGLSGTQRLDGSAAVNGVRDAGRGRRASRAMLPAQSVAGLLGPPKAGKSFALSMGLAIVH